MNLTIEDLKVNKQNSVDALITECNIFFAFSNEQLEEGIKNTPLTEGDKFVSIGSGGYMPKSKVNQFTEGMEQINKTFNKAVKSSKELRYKHIAYELANHEAYYTGSIDDTMDSLGGKYTRAEVLKVYQKERLTADV